MRAGRFRGAVVLLGILAMVIVAAGSDRVAAASAADPIKGSVTGLTCPDPHRCTGFLAGVDGTALDSDLVLPNTAHYPLLVFIHGWGGNKGNGAPGVGYPGDQFFVDRGYAILRYSTRGFGKSWGLVGMAAPDKEIEDIRSLVSAIVDDGRFGVMADRIGVTGVSYGGAHAWMVATRPTWTTPAGRPVRLAAVAPVATWTNLASSLLPNGREDDPSSPVGSPKLSFLTGMIVGGIRRDPERPYPNYRPEIPLLYARALAGEPFQLGSARDPLATQLRDFLQARSVAARTDWLQQLRSDPSSRVPIFAIQGWTDELFPASEAIRMVRALKDVSPDYPVKLYLGDIGHPRSANKAGEVDRISALVVQWFDYWLKSEGARPAFDVQSATTTPGPFDPAQVVTAGTVDGLSSGVVSTSFAGPFILVNQPVQLGRIPADPVTPVLPVVGGVLHRLPSATGDAGGVSPLRRVEELARGNPVWYQGRGRVRLTGAVLGTDVQYDVRLWDRDEHGAMVLVDRGTTKFVGSPGLIKVQVDLFGNAWTFLPGHQLILEVTNVDLPYLRPNNFPSTTILSEVSLELPVRGTSHAGPVAPARVWEAAGVTIRGPAGAGVQTAEPPVPELSAKAPLLGRAAALSAGAPGETVRAVANPAPAPDDHRPVPVTLLAAPFLLPIAVAASRRRARSP